MKTIKQYINEALKINSKSKIKKTNYNVYPKTRLELLRLIEVRVLSNGNNCDLNDIDVSEITDMSSLFTWSSFNGDISQWDVSNVTNMSGMFAHSKFNQDISNWEINDKCSHVHFDVNSNLNKNYLPKFKI
jgi:surface protein